MSSRVDYLFFEPPVGTAIFKVVHQADTVGHNLKEVQESVGDLQKFGRMIQLVNYTPATGTPDVFGSIQQLAKGQLPDHIRAALELSLPKTGKKAKITLGIPDKYLAVAIRNVFPGIACETPDTSAVTASLLRGIRTYYTKLIDHMDKADMNTISAVTGTIFSRGRVKYSPQRDDKYIIAAITSLDSLDKGLNLFGMRVREWYGSHFPELFNVVREPIPYVKLVLAIGDKSSLGEASIPMLEEIVGEGTDAAESIVRAARTSVGVDLRTEDLDKIQTMANLFLGQAEVRACTALYLDKKLNLVCPNLQIILGTVLTARLIAQAGSLKELAKKPGSTFQILGAEKALFRALKVKGNTPKYGLLFHASYVSKAKPADKGRIARYLANKCVMAARIDAFSQDPGTHFGEAFKAQVEGRLRFLTTGEHQPKNEDVMAKVMALLGDAADVLPDSDDEGNAMDVDPEQEEDDGAAMNGAEKAEKRAKEEKKAKKEEKRAKKEEKRAKREEKKAKKEGKKAKREKVQEEEAAAATGSKESAQKADAEVSAEPESKEKKRKRKSTGGEEAVESKKQKSTGEGGEPKRAKKQKQK